MKKNEIKMSFWHQLALAVFYGLHVLGATALIIIALALCGVPMRWWVGFFCTIPGYLVCEGLTEYIWRQNRKRERAFKKLCREIDEVVVKTLKEVQVQSTEDPDTVYIQEGDIRRIIHEGKEVGWYRWE